MNKQEVKTGKRSKHWTHMIETIRVKLNHFRIKKLPKNIRDYEYPFFDMTEKTEKGKLKFVKPKYKINDMVNVLLDEPQDALGHKQNTKNFRMGDVTLSLKKHKVIDIFYYAGKERYRYALEGLPRASFTESEIRVV